MGQSLSKNYLHITFSTKYRQQFIINSIEDELYSYLSAICYDLECYPVKIGGHLDHVHILCLLSKKIALMKLLEEVKSSSSKWIKNKHSSLKTFYWQDGYGAFSVSPLQVNNVKVYIEKQKEHHRKLTFKDELRGFLKQNNVNYDERYIWD